MSRWIARLLCICALPVMFSHGYKEYPTVLTAPEPPIAPSTLLQRARHQFETSGGYAGDINNEHTRHHLPGTPHWDQARPIRRSCGQALLVPVYAHEPVYMPGGQGWARPVGQDVTYLLVYVGEDHQLHFELTDDVPALIRGGAEGAARRPWARV